MQGIVSKRAEVIEGYWGWILLTVVGQRWRIGGIGSQNFSGITVWME